MQSLINFMKKAFKVYRKKKLLPNILSTKVKVAEIHVDKNNFLYLVTLFFIDSCRPPSKVFSPMGEISEKTMVLRQIPSTTMQWYFQFIRALKLSSLKS